MRSRHPKTHLSPPFREHGRCLWKRGLCQPNRLFYAVPSGNSTTGRLQISSHLSESTDFRIPGRLSVRAPLRREALPRGPGVHAAPPETWTTHSAARLPARKSLLCGRSAASAGQTRAGRARNPPLQARCTMPEGNESVNSSENPAQGASNF